MFFKFLEPSVGKLKIEVKECCKCIDLRNFLCKKKKNIFLKNYYQNFPKFLHFKCIKGVSKKKEKTIPVPPAYS